ncbi:FKBP-type peptidyl-prolyl cis-trans isomerase [Microbacterium mangrovi]|uniref:FKBP-type peptidyl-prolyl cis-trans isomerase n=1 Tax=Microbacterium mangrovi TaxID=1348253 RepID=UPI001E52B1D9|nr:FKBP-type peptidyl-prolyl cis-trans isomerase [Microbacterium mangrovi]
MAALTLAGCASSTNASSSSASPSASAATNLCDAKVPSGSASDSVKVSGKVGDAATVSFKKGVTASNIQSTVVTKGSGQQLKSGDLVEFALTEYNAKTGAKNGAIGQTDGSLLPQQISADSVLGKVLGCATVGTRVVAVMPGTSASSSGSATTQASVDVIDVKSVVPTAAWGKAQPAEAGMPTVKLAANGEPTITVPKTAAPKTTKVAVLKKGDGATVHSGDTVLVQYTGVLWKDGKVFDSSWKNGSPASFATDKVVKGFGKALTGATVGSQVLVVIPPADGYGSTAQGSIPANSTLVFTIDILGVQHARG